MLEIRNLAGGKAPVHFDKLNILRTDAYTSGDAVTVTCTVRMTTSKPPATETDRDKGVGGGERERWRQRQTDRQTETETEERERDRQTDRQRQRQGGRETETDRQRDRDRQTETDRFFLFLLTAETKTVVEGADWRMDFPAARPLPHRVNPSTCTQRLILSTVSFQFIHTRSPSSPRRKKLSETRCRRLSRDERPYAERL